MKSMPAAKKGSSIMRRTIQRTRNGGTWTEAKYWGTLRSALRNWAKWWKPAMQARSMARVGRGTYQCATCGCVVPSKQIQVDHVVPCGTLASTEDIASFIERLTPESPEAFQAICKDCHQKKTNLERLRRKEK